MRLGSAICSLICFASTVDAAGPEVRRIAVIVGANKAAPGRTRLRYSHADARRLAGVLADAGHFAERDLHVLLDPEPMALLGTLDGVLRDIPEQSLLFFYYSGHADAQSIYPDGKPLPFAALRERLSNERAAVRIGFIDACRGGAWTGSKGLSTQPAFDVPASLGLDNSGSVLIAASAGLEDAHESEALGGSFFTHHFIAGLRGAADRGNDGEVSLGEAFTYAQALTVRDTATQTEVPQHPTFDMNLRGRQDLALTRPASSPSSLTVQQAAGPMQLIAMPSGDVVVELEAGQREVLIALPAGRYLVRRRDAGGYYSREVRVAAGTTQVVREDELVTVDAGRLARKGDEPVRVEVPLSAGAVNEGMGIQSPIQSGFSLLMTMPHFSISFAALWRITERLTWAVGSGAFAYRFGNTADLEVTASAGLTHWGWGRPSTNSYDAYDQFFATLAAGVDGRRWLNPRHSLTWSTRASSSPMLAVSSAPLAANGAVSRYRRRGLDHWQGAAAFGYTVDLGAWTLHAALSYAQLIVDEGRIARYDPIIGIGALDYDGLRPLPSVQYHFNRTLSADGYVALTVRPRTTTFGYLVGANLLLGLTLRF